MPSTRHASCLCLLALASLAACSRPGAPRAQLSLASERGAIAVAAFEGRYDQATGTLDIQAVPTEAAGAAADPLGRVAFTPFVNGVAGGPPDSFELRNGPTQLGSGNNCGGVGPSWEGDVVLSSYFTTQSFSNVAVELTFVSSGFEACDDTPAYGGMGSTFGLWDYGPIPALGWATRTWRFNLPSSTSFVFSGRIMAVLDSDPTPANGATSFEWTPSLFMDPPHSFQPVGFTTAHVVWNGTTFERRVGPVALSFVAVGSPGSTSVGLIYPAQPYAGPFSGSSYFVADAAHGGNSFDTTGDFTVCAKFKPGASPAPGEYRVLVGKGNPEDDAGRGWALTHFFGIEPEYSFSYNTGSGSFPVRSIVGTQPVPQTAPPAVSEERAYEYACGGRSGGTVSLDAYGQLQGTQFAVTGNFSADAPTLPLVIGAAQGGLHPDVAGGVYEVIWDSRAATLAVMNQIVAAAEGRATTNGAYEAGSIPYRQAVTGADLAAHVLPKGANVPLSTDGSGLLDAGAALTFSQALAAGTGSYCAGAVISSSDWTTATGYILSGGEGTLRLLINANGTVVGTNGGAFSGGQNVGLRSWAAGSRHALKVCATPHPGIGNVTLHVDNVQVWANPEATTSDLSDLSTTTLLVGAGVNGSTPLTGARIGRVFACPTAVAGSCI